jgi:uncharacterized protein (TIGR03663 family)
MSSSLFYRLALALIVAGAFWLRIHELDRRPMHADEANQAVKSGDLLESGHYIFDPHDHHGPTLYYAVLPIAWLRGERNLASLTETTVRLIPAIAGTLSVLLLAALICQGWAGPSGHGNGVPDDVVAHSKLVALPTNTKPRWLALLAAAFLAVSPPAVYYSRYFIQETLLATFILAACVGAQRWWRSGHLAWAIFAGASAGLAQATKASAPLFLGAAIIAAALARLPLSKRPGFISHAAVAIGTALGVAALFYSSFGTNPGGIHDAFAVYGPALHRAGEGAGHDKPWTYYLQLFGRQRNGGLLWQQVLFSALAIVGIVTGVFQSDKFVRCAAIYTGIVALTLSFTPYKTPWHAIHFVPGMAVLAAAAITSSPRVWQGAFVGTIALVSQFSQTRLAAFSRPADPRNPYAYVHSSPDVLKYRALAETALATSPQGIVRVIGREYWPLPWYLRGLPRVGYWSTPPEDCDGALVITTESEAPAVRQKLRDHYRETFLGLRPDVLCVVFTRQP